MSTSSEETPRGFRWVRWALLAFPAGFRSRWGEELADDLKRVLAAPGANPWLVAAGLVWSGLLERWSRGIATRGAGKRANDFGRGTMGIGISVLRQELGVAVRALARRPGFAAIAALTIALGIGANTTVFSVAEGVLLRPLPFDEPDRLVRVGGYREGEAAELGSLAHPEVEAMEELQAFSTVLAFRSSEVALTGMGVAEMIPAARVTRGLFTTLGRPPALGRDFRPEEAADPTTRRAIVSWDFWMTRWGGDSDVVGRTITLDSESWEVIGVAAPGSGFPREFDLWLPGGMLPDGGCWWRCTIFDAIARLAPGTSLEQAREQLAGLGLRLEESVVGQTGRRFTAEGLHASVVADVRDAIWILLGAVGLVLMVACANVAQLFLVRGTARRAEFAVRRALGASRRRLLLAVLSESLVVATVGALLGLGLAEVGVRTLPALAQGAIPRSTEIRLHSTVLLFTLGVTLLSTLLFGLLPGLRASRGHELGVGLRRAGRGETGRRGPQWLLLTGEVALSLVLLIGAGLLLRTFGEMTSTDLGFRTAGLTRFDVSLPEAGYDEEAQVQAFIDRLTAELERMPGIEGVSVGVSPPLSQDRITGGFTFLDRPEPAPGEGPSAHLHVATAGFFELYDVAVVAGRPFQVADRPGEPTAFVVSEAFVRRYFEEGVDPLDEPIRLGLGFGFSRAPGRIVGVVEDVRSYGLGAEMGPAIYVPHPQLLSGFFTVTVGHRGRTLEPRSVMDVLASIDRNVPLSGFEPMEEAVAREAASTRFYLSLLGSFALLALVMAAVGLYGVVAYAVSRRTREIGLRAALGADSRRIVQMVLRQGLMPTAAGVGLGLAGALGLTRLLSALLYEVHPLDPATFVAVPVILVGVAFLAVWIPARRASRVDPMAALRTME